MRKAFAVSVVLTWILLGLAAARPCAAQTDSIPPPAPSQPDTAAAPATAPPATTDAAPPAAQSEHVKRAVFTSGVVDREPSDELSSIGTEATQVFFFTEIVGMEGATVKHRWIFGGETIAEVPFAIGGPRWRVYSSKTLMPDLQGTWKVEVVDDAGNVLAERSIGMGGA